MAGSEASKRSHPITTRPAHWKALYRRWRDERSKISKTDVTPPTQRVTQEPHRDILRTQAYGRPKGKLKRPKGTLSIHDIMVKYKILNRTLTRWRKMGLPCRKIGHLVVIKERDLKDWIQNL